ncbi:MAG: hypothetical protein HXS46_09335 [Theionarchaea archaeon]|nr:MAG: hypothetical protein AYK18_16440 [Theionarchaea archaeon DG-70]MBU7010881.1 hypothetical protein [Theionarchaea archaeon]
MRGYRNLLVMAILLIFLVISQSAHCENNKEIELKSDFFQSKSEIYYTPAGEPKIGYFYTFTVENYGITPDGDQEHKVDVIIPLDIEVHSAHMKLKPEEWAATPIPIVTMGSYTLSPLEDEPFEYEFAEELKSIMEDPGDNLEEGECRVRIPFVFQSTQEGTITLKEFVIKYRIHEVEDVGLVVCPDTKIPIVDAETRIPLYLSWKGGRGPNPRYELQIRKANNFADHPYDENVDNILLKIPRDTTEPRINGTFYELTADISSLRRKLEPEETYYWGVRAFYSDIGYSKWGTREFKIEPEENDTGKPELMPPEGLNVIPATEGGLIFTWNLVSEAEEYKIEISGFEDGSVKLPYIDERGEPESKKGPIWINNPCYYPWDKKYKEYAGLNLKTGERYKWTVYSVRGYDEKSSEHSFVYQPTYLWKLMLCAASGGLLGGFFRVAMEERSRKEERKVKIYKDYRIYMELLVGAAIGAVFYLLANQALEPPFDLWGISPFNNAGSFLFGVFGGFACYELLARLKSAILK